MFYNVTSKQFFTARLNQVYAGKFCNRSAVVYIFDVSGVDTILTKYKARHKHIQKSKENKFYLFFFPQLKLLTDFVMTHLTRELNLAVDWKCFDVDGIASTSATNKSFAL